MKKYLLNCIIIGLLLIGLTACANQKKTGPLIKGRNLEKDGEYVAALHHYEKMKNEDFSRGNIQNLYYLYGDILEAMQALNSGDSSAEQYYQLGEAYYQKAQSVPEMAEIAPNSGQFDLNNFFEQRRGQLQENAMAALNTTTQMQPSHQEALWLEGRLYEERGEAEQAILAYQKMLEVGTGSVGILSQGETGMMTIAAEDPAISRQNAKALSRLGQLLYEQGEYEQGLEFTKLAIFHDPENAETYFNLGELYARQGDSAHAIIQYEAAICTEPTYLEAYYRIARVYLLRSEPIEAERVLKVGRLSNPEALHLGLFHTALKKMLDQREQEQASQIIQLLAGQPIPDDLGTLDVSEQNYDVQLLYFNLRLQLLQRQQPYWLACSDKEAHPYFATQMARTLAKIDNIEEILRSAE